MFQLSYDEFNIFIACQQSRNLMSKLKTVQVTKGSRKKKFFLNGRAIKALTLHPSSELWP